MSTSVDSLKVILYDQGTWSSATVTEAMKQAANDVAASGFGTVNLGQWHVWADGSIFYNDTRLSDVLDTLKTIVPMLKSTGQVQKVLVSFGPFAKDFQDIEDNLSSFKQTMENLFQEVDQLDGFDWDLEQQYEPYTDLIVDLTQWAVGNNWTVTAAPYTDMSFWTDVLKQTNANGQQGFAWWNLQLYGGADYPSWVQGLKGLVSSPESFVVPAYKITTQVPTAQDLQKALTSLHAQYADLAGAGIWRYEDIKRTPNTTAEYAAAIVAGVE